MYEEKDKKKYRINFFHLRINFRQRMNLKITRIYIKFRFLKYEDLSGKILYFLFIFTSSSNNNHLSIVHFYSIGINQFHLICI